MVAAAQRGRVVAHAAADGAVERQQVAMRPAQPLAGIGAEPVEQVLTVGLVALERRPGPAHRGLAAQEVGEQRLVVGAVGVRSLQRGQCPGMGAGAARGLGQEQPGGREVAGRLAADLGQRTVVVGGSGQSVRDGQRIAGQGDGAVGVVVQRRGRVAHEGGEPDGVDLGRVDAEPVAGGVAHDRVGAAGGPRARDQHLQALRRVGRRLVAPDQVDQPLAAHGPPAGGRQRRQQRLRTLPGDGGSPPAHVPEQGQGEGHRRNGSLGGVFDHVGVAVADLAASERFYRTVLSALGVEPSYADAELVEWDDWDIGPTDREHPVTRGLHVGFRAPSRAAVDAFWQAGIDAGYRDDGAPGPRAVYGPDYYGGFLLDPDGNSAEAVHTEREDPVPDGSIDHLWIRVRDPAASKRFYTTIAPHAGLRIGVDEPDHVQVVGDDFSFSLIADERRLTEHVHLAFGAQDDATVRAFHAAALAAGYEDHGGPGERAVYHPGYYGAFVLDPDGHNVEVVNHNR